MLTTGSYFIKEKGFEELNPVYQVSSYDIQEYIKERLLESKSESEKGLWLHHAKGKTLKVKWVYFWNESP